MGQTKTLIHVHTDYSYDSNISLEVLADFARKEGFGSVAVTDHDTIEGAKRFREMTNIQVIVGQEVTTRDGHLIGLFLTKRVPPGMSAEKTAGAIRDQGGLVLLPHPFVRIFGCGLGKLAWQMRHLLDAVEVNNAQNLRRTPDLQARHFAEQTRIAKYAGSDSHLSSSIAPCYQVMRDFTGPDEFLASLRCAELMEGRHPLSYFATIGYQVTMTLARQAASFGSRKKAPRTST